MRKEKLLIIIIVVLTLLNVAQLAVWYFRPLPPRRGGEKPEKFVEKAVATLDLDAEQEKAFTEFGHIHRQTIDSLKAEHIRLLTTYFDNPTPAVLERIKEIEAEKIVATQKNFEQIKSILKQEQHQGFEPFKEQVLKVILK